MRTLPSGRDADRSNCFRFTAGPIPAGAIPTWAIPPTRMPRFEFMVPQQSKLGMPLDGFVVPEIVWMLWRRQPVIILSKSIATWPLPHSTRTFSNATWSCTVRHVRME